MNVSIRGLAAAALLAAAMVRPVAAEGITLHGAVQFGDEHTFNKTLLIPVSVQNDLVCSG